MRSSQPLHPTSSSAPACTASRPPTTSRSSSSAGARLGRRHRRPRQGEPGDRCDRDRLRRRPQQLLPAGDERAHAGVRRGVGVRSRGVPLQRRSATSRSAPRCRSPTSSAVRAAGADRLPVGADRRRGRGRRPHEAPLPGLARQGVTVCLHEHQGGFAFNLESVAGLRDKCLVGGSQILRAHGGDGLRKSARTTPCVAVETSRGSDRSRRAGRHRPRAVGAAASGRCSGSPTGSTCTRRRATSLPDQPMWTYWNLQEGEITVDPMTFATADGGAPPVIHLDTDAPLYTDDGRLVTDELWGIYYKRDRHGVQGGASPLDGRRRHRARPVSVDDGRRPGLPGHVVRGALPRDGALRGMPRPVQDGPVGGRRRVHRRTTSPSSTGSSRTSTRSSTRTTATR